MLLKISIVEDNEEHRKNLEQLLNEYGKNKSIVMEINTFVSGEDYQAHRKQDEDLVFLDISMGGQNGIEVAKKLRKLDNDVLIVFVTDLSQYALQGYQVSALDYILKPIDYSKLALLMDRVVRQIEKKGEQTKISIKTDQGLYILLSDDLIYVEVIDHWLVFHMANGDTMKSFGSLKNVEALLDPRQFAKCNTCYLVNMKYIKLIQGYNLYLDNIEKPILISHPRKKEFLQRFTAYLGDNA